MIIRLFHTSRLPASARRPGLIRKAVRLALGRHARKKADLDVLFVTDRRIREINREALDHDYETDVIAFPSEPAFPHEKARLPFGEIVISADRARAQAKDMGHPVLREVLTLAAHGALHLTGYRDHRPREKARMFKRQDAVLRAVLGS